VKQNLRRREEEKCVIIIIIILLKKGQKKDMFYLRTWQFFHSRLSFEVFTRGTDARRIFTIVVLFRKLYFVLFFFMLWRRIEEKFTALNTS